MSRLPRPPRLRRPGQRSAEANLAVGAGPAALNGKREPPVQGSHSGNARRRGQRAQGSRPRRQAPPRRIPKSGRSMKPSPRGVHCDDTRHKNLPRLRRRVLGGSVGGRLVLRDRCCSWAEAGAPPSRPRRRRSSDSPEGEPSYITFRCDRLLPAGTRRKRSRRAEQVALGSFGRCGPCSGIAPVAHP